MDKSNRKNYRIFNILLIVSALFIIACVILDVMIRQHELFENQQVFERAISGQLLHHQYFKFYGTKINVTDWGFLMLRIVPASILFILWFFYMIFGMRAELDKPQIDEQDAQ